jgi:hypothetical protein
MPARENIGVEENRGQKQQMALIQSSIGIHFAGHMHVGEERVNPRRLVCNIWMASWAWTASITSKPFSRSESANNRRIIASSSTTITTIGPLQLVDLARQL